MKVKATGVCQTWQAPYWPQLSYYLSIQTRTKALVYLCGRTESDTTEVTQQQQQQASLVAQMVKNLPTMQEAWVQSMGWEDPLEKGMATHSSTQSMGSQRVGHF